MDWRTVRDLRLAVRGVLTAAFYAALIVQDEMRMYNGVSVRLRRRLGCIDNLA